MSDQKFNSPDEEAIRKWWRTSIIDMEPGKIAFRGQPVETLIGNISFGQMIWFMVVGQMPKPEQAALLEAALVAGVDHGPQAPSILSLIHISEPTRLRRISYAVLCLKKKKVTFITSN